MVVAVRGGAAIQRGPSATAGRARRAGGSASAALAALAAVPLVVLGALAFSERGIGGTVSDRWHDLTKPSRDPAERAGPADRDRQRALDLLGRARRHLGGPPGRRARAPDPSPRPSFATGTSRPRAGTRTDTCTRRSPTWAWSAWPSACCALVAWLVAVAPARSRLRRGSAARPGRPSASACSRWRWWRSCSACTRRSTGPGSCRRSRSPASSAPAGSPAADRSAAAATVGHRAAARRAPSLPRGRGAARRGSLVGAVVVARRRWPHWRSRSRGAPRRRATMRCALEQRRLRRRPARPTAPRTSTRCRSSPTSSWRRSRTPPETAAAVLALEDAVRLEPASPEAWRRLGEYYLAPLDQPGRAPAGAARRAVPRPALDR